MAKFIEPQALKPHTREIIRLRCEDLLCWRAIARHLLQGEVASGAREPDDLADPVKSLLLVESYRRACVRLFNGACQMGFASAPPAGTVFRDSPSTPGLPSNTDALTRLRRLVAEVDRAESDPEADDQTRKWARGRVRSERLRLQHMLRRAADRVRSGRPFATATEARRFGKASLLWESGGYVPSPYPAVSDRELLGDDRYQELIAQRVDEVRRTPGFTERDLFFAEHPEMLPIPGGARQEDFWDGGSPDPKIRGYLLDAKRALVVLGLLASVTYDLKRGRVGLHALTLRDIVGGVLDHAAGPELTNHPMFRALWERAAQCRDFHLHQWLANAIRNYRDRLGFARPLDPSRVARLRRFMELHAQIETQAPKIPLDSAELTPESAYRAWLVTAWPPLEAFFQRNPSFTV